MKIATYSLLLKARSYIPSSIPSSYVWRSPTLSLLSVQNVCWFLITDHTSAHNKKEIKWKVFFCFFWKENKQIVNFKHCLEKDSACKHTSFRYRDQPSLYSFSGMTIYFVVFVWYKCTFSGWEKHFKMGLLNIDILKGHLLWKHDFLLDERDHFQLERANGPWPHAFPNPIPSVLYENDP